MGRRENAVAQVTQQLTDLALWLRGQRQICGLTYAAMAKKTDYTSTMLSRAASGSTVPSWGIVEAYTRACRADLRTAERKWKAARWADQLRRRRERDEEFPGAAIAAKFYDIFAAKPQLIDDFAKLRLGMIGLRAKAGHPSLTALQDRAGRASDGKLRLPASSLGAILRFEAVPRRRHVIAFVTAIGAPPKTVLAWGEAWDRASGKQKRRVRADAHHVRRSSPPNAFARSGHPLVMRGFLLDDPETPAAHDGPAPGPPGLPTPSGTAAGLRPEDVAFLQTHGLSVGPSPTAGPNRSMPPGGYTAAGLPIRVPRRQLPPVYGGPSGPPQFLQMRLRSP